MYHLALILIALVQGTTQTPTAVDRERITILNAGPPISYSATAIDAGPSTGDMLNAHFFPGINFYNAGRYISAEAELGYVAGRPHYLDGNARRNEFMSTSNYLVGMIYMYHAEGVGRRTIAKSYFEKAIEWNPSNHMAYLELARVFAELHLPKQAIEVLQRLLELNPAQDIANQARDEIAKFSEKK